MLRLQAEVPFAALENLNRWSVVSNDFGEAIPLHFAIEDKNPQHLALTTHQSEVLESTDGGATWHPFGSRGK
jgi:hypothetical protein